MRTRPAVFGRTNCPNFSHRKSARGATYFIAAAAATTSLRVPNSVSDRELRRQWAWRVG